jgi:hypothetical protein
MNRKAVTIIIAAVLFLFVGAAVAVKMIWFPSVQDAWFATNSQKLRRVPAGIVVVRPTHFPKTATNALVYSNGRKSGRNVTFQQLMASAYNHDAGRVFLPPGTPKNNFDFLVTVPGADDGLRAAVRKKTGYIGNVENRETDVLALKVVDASSPGLKVSDAGEKSGQSMKNGRLYLTHQKIGEIVGGIGDIVKMPVVDKTELKDFYDFSFVWNQKIARGDVTRDDVDNIIKEWGLALEPDTASVEMLVVKKN